MAEDAQTNPPSRYAVQRPRGKKWDTLHVDEDRDAAMAVFRQVAAALPRSFVRLIIVEYESSSPASDFRWRLLELYDPFQSGTRSREDDEKRKKARDAKEAKQSPASARGNGRKRSGDKVRPPVRMYVWAIVAGLLAGAVAFHMLAPR